MDELTYNAKVHGYHITDVLGFLDSVREMHPQIINLLHPEWLTGEAVLPLYYYLKDHYQGVFYLITENMGRVFPPLVELWIRHASEFEEACKCDISAGMTDSQFAALVMASAPLTQEDEAKLRQIMLDKSQPGIPNF